MNYTAPIKENAIIGEEEEEDGGYEGDCPRVFQNFTLDQDAYSDTLFTGLMKKFALCRLQGAFTYSSECVSVGCWQSSKALPVYQKTSEALTSF